MNDYTINVELEATYTVAAADYFARAVAFVLRAEGVPPPLEVSVRLVDDATIQQYNRDYLGHDRPTDVIAFGLEEQDVASAASQQPAPHEGEVEREAGSEPAYWQHEDAQVAPALVEQQVAGRFLLPAAEAMLAEGETPYLGDIIASYETAAQQAADYGHTPLQELTELVMHGTLHLLGYDDHAEESYRLMHRHEDRHLAAFLAAEAAR